MSLSQLAKLNPKTTKLEVAGSGGTSRITWEDIAGSLHGLPAQAIWLAYATLETHSNDAPTTGRKYTNQMIDFLTGHIWSQMLAKSFIPRSRTKEQFSAGIARVVMYTSTHSAGHCNMCNGQRWQLVDAKKETCRLCAGYGTAEFSNTQKYAMAFNVDIKTVTKVQRDYYLHHCASYEDHAKAIVSSLMAMINEGISKLYDEW